MNTEQVNCGNHNTSSCANCPNENGTEWCDGDCHLLAGHCILKSIEGM